MARAKACSIVDRRLRDGPKSSPIENVFRPQQVDRSRGRNIRIARHFESEGIPCFDEACHRLSSCCYCWPSPRWHWAWTVDPRRPRGSAGNGGPGAKVVFDVLVPDDFDGELN